MLVLYVYIYIFHCMLLFRPILCTSCTIFIINKIIQPNSMLIAKCQTGVGIGYAVIQLTKWKM